MSQEKNQLPLWSLSVSLVFLLTRWLCFPSVRDTSQTMPDERTLFAFVAVDLNLVWKEATDRAERNGDTGRRYREDRYGAVCYVCLRKLLIRSLVLVASIAVIMSREDLCTLCVEDALWSVWPCAPILLSNSVWVCLKWMCWVHSQHQIKLDTIYFRITRSRCYCAVRIHWFNVSSWYAKAMVIFI